MVQKKAQMGGAFMASNGTLWGNGKHYDDRAGDINEGQIVSMEADLDKGTLRFWVDGKPHGPGHRYPQQWGARSFALGCGYF